MKSLKNQTNNKHEELVVEENLMHQLPFHTYATNKNPLLTWHIADELIEICHKHITTL